VIECTRFKAYEKGYLKGFADIYIPAWGIEMKGFTLYEKDGKRWVNPPGKEYEDKDGEKKFGSFFFFREKEHYAKFVSQVKDAIEKAMPKEEKEEEFEDFKEPTGECPF